MKRASTAPAAAVLNDEGRPGRRWRQTMEEGGVGPVRERTDGVREGGGGVAGDTTPARGLWGGWSATGRDSDMQAGGCSDQSPVVDRESRTETTYCTCTYTPTHLHTVP